jgi:hypothetical protein
LILLNHSVLEFSIIKLFHFSEDDQVVEQMQKQQERNGSQSVKDDPEVLSVEQQRERRFQDALEDDEVREALKILHARDKERTRETKENESVKTDRQGVL